MADRTIEYKLIIDTQTGKQTVTDLNGAVVNLEASTKIATTEFTNMLAKTRDLTIAYQGLLNNISSVKSVFTEFINAASEQEDAELRLKTALKNTGDATQETNENLLEYSQTLREKTNIDSDAITKAQAYGLQIGLNTSQIKEATKGAIGLSVAYGEDLQTAMKQVSLGMQGEYGELGRLNPAIMAAKDESEKAAIFQKMLADSYEMAGEKAHSYAGEIANLDMKIDDAKKQFGFLLRDALKPIIVFFGEHMPAVAAVAVGALVSLVIPVYTLITALKVLTIETALATGGVSILVAGMVALTANMLLAPKPVDKLTQSLKDLKKIHDDYSETVKKYNKEQAQETIRLLELEIKNRAINANNLYAEREALRNLETTTETQRGNRIKDLYFIDQKIEKENFYRKSAETQREAAYQRITDITKAEQEAHNKKMTLTDEQIKKAKELHDAEKKIWSEKLAEAEAERAYNAQVEADESARTKEIEAETNNDKIEQQKRFAEMVNQVRAESEVINKKENDELKEKIATEKELQDAKDKTVQDAKDGLKQLDSNMKQAAKLGKEAAAVSKGVSIANTTMATYESATLAFKSFAEIPFVGVPLGIAAAAAAVAAGLANVAAITATKGFKSGGYTGNGSIDDIAGVTHGQEFVNDAETVKRVGLNNLESLQSGNSKIVPVGQVPTFNYSGSASSSNIENSIQALSANFAGSNNQKETLIINNSDFVSITRKVEETKAENKNLNSAKSIGSYSV